MWNEYQKNVSSFVFVEVNKQMGESMMTKDGSNNEIEKKNVISFDM